MPRTKHIPERIEIAGVDADGNMMPICRLETMPMPPFIWFIQRERNLGTRYQRIDANGQAHEPRQKLPRPWDLWLSRNYESITRQVSPRHNGVYLITLAPGEDSELPESLYHRYAIYHDKIWYRVMENTLKSARTGLEHLDYTRAHSVRQGSFWA